MRGRVGPEETKAGITRVARVGVAVADVVVRRRREPSAHIGQPMLEDHEVRRDAQSLPQRPLVGERPIRAAADEIAEALGRVNERDRDDARRLADLQGAVDVEADERDAAQGSPAPGTSTRTLSIAPSRLSAMAGPLPVLVHR